MSLVVLKGQKLWIPKFPKLSGGSYRYLSDFADTYPVQIVHRDLELISYREILIHAVKYGTIGFPWSAHVEPPQLLNVLLGIVGCDTLHELDVICSKKCTCSGGMHARSNQQTSTSALCGELLA